MWGDQHWTRLPGGRASIEVGEGVVYLTMSLRNVGSGMAVIHGWRAVPSPGFSLERQPELLQHPELQQHPGLDEFRAQGRDLYVPPATAASGRARSAPVTNATSVSGRRSPRRSFAAR